MKSPIRDSERRPRKWTNVKPSASRLFVQFETRGGTVRAVDGVSFSLRQGERLGLVGRIGKRQVDDCAGAHADDQTAGAHRGGKHHARRRTDITKVPARGDAAIRFGRIAMIPQGAMNSLNPVRRMRDQFMDAMRAHGIRENDKQTRTQNRRAAAIGRSCAAMSRKNIRTNSAAA